MKKKKRNSIIIMGTLLAVVLLVTTGCDLAGPDANEDGDSDSTNIVFQGATQTGGISGTTDSTGLTLSFDGDPSALTADYITITGATKGALSGNGTTRSLGISDITVGNGETLSVTITSPDRYAISGSSKTALVYRHNTAIAFWGINQAGGASGTTDTTGLTLSFDVDPSALTAEHITVTGATKGALSGIGLMRNIAISDITVGNGETVSVAITSPGGYAISGSPKTGVVYRYNVPVAFQSAVQTGGTSGTTDSTGLILTFDGDPTTLTTANINVTGATKGALSGSGTTRSLGIYNITVGDGETLSVTVTSPDGYAISGSTKTAVVYRHPFTVLFDVQGGDALDPATKEVTNGQPYGVLPTPTREKHTFDGWATKRNRDGRLVTEASIFTETSDLTLYARWFFNVYEGPAGGLVFYENLNYAQDGWRYLEAAPYGWYDGVSDSEGAYTGDNDPEFEWGATGYTITPRTEIFIGTGANNTENIVTYHDSLITLYPERGDYYTNGTKYYSGTDGTVAAKVCYDYSRDFGGQTYDDWFLPSKIELDLMHKHLELQDLGELSGYYYWSSSVKTRTNAWGGYFSDLLGFIASNARWKTFSVRPIRAFM